MEDNVFWDYVMNSVDKIYTDDDELLELVMTNSMQDIRNRAIHNRLLKSDFDTSEAFQMGVSERICQLYLPHVVELFIITAYSGKVELGKPNYFSTDGFIDFRAQIVSLGKKRFEQFLNFESEESIIDLDLNANHFYNEAFAYIGSEVASILDESKSVDYYFDGDYEDLQSKIDWANLDTKYSKLWAKYQRIT